MDERMVIDVMRNSEKRFLIIGDIMLDEYIFCDVTRISPEAPVPVAKVKRRKYSLGGCGNVAANIRSLGGEIDVLSVVGCDEENANLVHEMLDPLEDCLIRDFERFTTVKRRVIAHSQQVIRIDEEDIIPICFDTEQEVINSSKRLVDTVDAVVISDYNKGVLTKQVLCTVIALCRKKKIPIIVDPKGENYSKYIGATLIAPNEGEAFIASGVSDVDKACRILSSKFKIKQVLITQGEKGMTFFDGKNIKHFSTTAEHVYDVTGAGDTVTAVMAFGLACGVDTEQCVHVANVAAGIVVGEIGTATVVWDKIFERW